MLAAKVLCAPYIFFYTRVTEVELEKFALQLPGPYLLLRDYNCRDPLWDDSVTIPSAPVVKSIFYTHDVGLLNTEKHTQYHRHTN